MHGNHWYYDIGVAMVDCVIVIVYTLHVWGPLELQLFYSTLGYHAMAATNQANYRYTKNQRFKNYK